MSLFCIIFLYNGDVTHFSTRVYISSILIQILSIIFIFTSDKYPYSLKKIFYLFSLFFFGIAPLIQFYSRSSFYGGRELSESEYFKMNLCILVIILTFHFVYTFFYKIVRIKRYHYDDYVVKKISPRQVIFLILLSLFSLGVTFYFLNFNLNKMFFRGVSGEEDTTSISSPFAMVVMQTVRPISIICLMYYLLAPNKKKIIVGLLLLLAILTIFPTSVARFYAAAVYLPLLLVAFKFTKIKNLFSLIFMIGLLVVFPFLNNFRNYDVNQKIKFGFDFEMFATGHFDSYFNFALIYFEDIITYGQQLLGVLFFWVPRSVWPSKPIGSGALLAEKLNLSWTNISANYFAEGFINFGIFGILLFTIVIAYFAALIDKKFWVLFINKENNFFKVLYFIILSMLFFTLRGDLLSATAFTVGFIVSYFFVFYFFTKIIKR